jgi:choline dehydrogenase-like flavoprotein
LIRHADTLAHAELVEAEVCVVGAGPVGLQIARRLARSGIEVVVIESGEDGASTRAQDLNHGQSAGRFGGKLRENRIRRLGGTMHVWGGNCRPLDPSDFMARPWVPLSGWPISHQSLQPYLADAHDALLLDSFSYEPEQPACLPSVESAFEEVLFRLSRLVPGTTERFLGEFSEYLRAELASARAPRILLGLTVVEIMLNEARSAVSSLFALTLDGRPIHLRARAYVLACGGIETPRLMLASRSAMGCGVGNAQDQVGRHFMEHPHGLGGLLAVPPESEEAFSLFSPGRRSRTSVIQHRLRLKESAQRERRVLNGSLQLISARMTPTETDTYASAFEDLMLGVDEAGTWSRFYVVYLGEQAPNPASRVSLATDETDFFGSPVACLDWRLTELDHRTIVTMMTLLAEDVVYGTPHVRLADRVEREIENWTVGYGAHHMGTTRMASDPRHGVVDRDCRVHGLSNLYCAGSSVFATAGMANPTMTAIALGFRLASHLTETVADLPPPADFGQPLAPPRFADLVA